MGKFNVTCTMIYNGSIDVDAESVDDAIDKVRDMLCDSSLDESLTTMPYSGTNCGITFNLGEATADDAYQIEEN